MNKQHPDLPILLTAKEAAARLKISYSWMAKARMRVPTSIDDGGSRELKLGVPQPPPQRHIADAVALADLGTRKISHDDAFLC